MQYIYVVGCFDQKVLFLLLLQVMLTPQKKLWSGWSLPGPAGQNNGEASEKHSNVLLHKECINVSSQEDDEQSLVNMRQKLSELENEVREISYHLIFIFMFSGRFT